MIEEGYVMKWDWQKLIIAVLSAVLGWFTNVVIPAPGSAVRAPVIQVQK